MKRILDNIVVAENKCWVWQKSCAGSGYGQLTVAGKYWQAHRYAYTQSKGVIPEGFILRHTCHNPKCCNPDHLITGTDKDNWQDSSDIHKSADAKRRMQWSIDGIAYDTVKQASQNTGIHQGTIIKYSDNGVFDVVKYRTGCIRARVQPKL